MRFKSPIKDEISLLQVKIVDRQGDIVPIGRPGEICVRGAQVMLGYWKDELRTKEVIKNGWYHTG